MIINGIPAVEKALQAHKAGKAAGAQRGLIKAGLFIQRGSQQIVPVDTGALKRSARTRARGAGFNCIVKVSYNMAYSAYVHEVVYHEDGTKVNHGEDFNRRYAREIALRLKQPWNGLKFHSRGVGQQAKFLESFIIANLKQITAIVVSEFKAAQ